MTSTIPTTLSAAQPTSPEPIAVVGIGCRYPGANNVDEFWDLLKHGRDAIGDIPIERFDADRYYDPRPSVRGKTVARRGGFIDGAFDFDAEYFRISPREAARIDPQQRLMLEICADAIDDSNLTDADLAGQPVGVYVGCWASDWEALEFADGDDADVYSFAGTGRCLISGRVSFAFDLRGPSLTVDTGCSASMVAVHLACQSLWAGETTAAICGGVNLVLLPKQSIGYSQAGMMAHDGRCKSFDHRADGFVRSDGCGAVVLMPLSQAQARGLKPYAVIRGTGSSNDGFSNGLLATPSDIGQEPAIRAAYQKAGLPPLSVQYVEGHGTGTLAGDPVELRALDRVLKDRDIDEPAPCWVGSVKSNIGHSEAAAGVAGLIKTVLAVHHRTIPSSLHCEEPTPEISWAETDLQVATHCEPWPDGVARAGVSSFGLSGTNVHVVVEEVDPHARLEPIDGSEPATTEAGPQLLVMSARGEPALHALAGRYQALLEQLPSGTEADKALADLCYSAAFGRRQHNLRLAVVGRDQHELTASLAAYLDGEPDPALLVERAAETAPDPVFVFSGQGSQWEGMARELIRTEPVFAEAMNACDRAMSSYADWSLLEELYRDRAGAAVPIDIIQPSIFALQVALVALLESYDVKPTLVVGHSMGEVAAAHVAGILSLDDAACIIVNRSRVLENLRGQGGMLSVELGLDEARAAIAAHTDSVSVAAANGRDSTVLSGDLAALREISEAMTEAGVVCREVQVDAAAHSPQLEPQLPDLGRALAHVSPNPDAPVAICSTVTEQLEDPDGFCADYWVRNMREPVRFAGTIELLLDQGHSRFIEIGPHPNLVGAIQQLIGAGGGAQALPTLTRNQCEQADLLMLLGRLHGSGGKVDLRPLYPPDATLVRLPRYPWQPDRYDELPSSAESATVGSEAGSLGRPTVSPVHPNTTLWTTTLSLAKSGYLRDHQVQNTPALPGAAYMNMALQAGRHLFDQRDFFVQDLLLDAALVLREDQPIDLSVSATRSSGGEYDLRFTTQIDGQADHVVHASGCLRLSESEHRLPAVDPEAMLLEGEPRGLPEHFAAAAARGIDYGPAFRGLEELRIDESTAVARVALPAEVSYPNGAFAVHPALLDACLQAYASAVFAYPPLTALYVPVSIGELHWYGEVGSEVLVRTVATSPPYGPEVHADVQIFDLQGQPLLEIRDLTVRAVGSPARRMAESLLGLGWLERPRPEEPGPDLSNQTWLVLMDDATNPGSGDQQDPVGDIVAESLEALGADCVRAWATDADQQDEQRDRGFLVDPASPSDLGALVAESAGVVGKPLAGIVDLWSLDTTIGVGESTSQLMGAQRRGVIGLTHLMQALAASDALSAAPTVFAVTAGAQVVEETAEVTCAQAPLWALARVLRYELSEIPCRTLDFPARPSVIDIHDLVDEVVSRPGPGEDEVALRGGQRHVLRLMPQPLEEDAMSKPLAADEPFRLSVGAMGSLDSLELRRSPRPAPGPGEVEIEVAVGGLNFIDVMQAYGIYPGTDGDEVPLGLECAGRVTRVGAGVSDFSPGQPVVAVRSGVVGFLARYVIAEEALVAPLPPSLDFAQGATAPAAFLTCHYALNHLGRLAAGERVLIHSATGGVGLAAIQMAKRVDAEIFATAGSPEKRDYLRQTMGIEHVFDSRSLDFADAIRERTGGEGVDVVLNSLTGDALEQSLALLRDDGRFLELGKRDIHDGMQLGMLPFKRGLSFSHIDVLRLLQDRSCEMGGMLREIMADLEAGTLDPLPIVRFPIEQVSDGFNLMAQAKHTGKIAVEVPPSTTETEALPSARLALGEQESTYVLTGGLGGLGRLVTRFLAERGVSHIALLGRSAPTPEAQAEIASLAEEGVEVQTFSCDAADTDQVAAVMQTIKERMPPIRGVFHAAAVLDDGVATQMTPERFETAMAPKMCGAFNLHAHTLDQPVEHFVLFASAAAVIGSPGQANYVAGNEYLDALAHQRKLSGLPAVSIDWPAWRESGVATGELRAGRLSMRGFGTVGNDEGLAMLERLMIADRTRAIVVPDADFHRWSEFYPSAAKTGLLDEMLKGGPATGGHSAGDEDLVERMVALGPDGLADHLEQCVRLILRLPSSKPIDLEAPLNRFGIDSLMAVELKNRIEVDLGLVVPVSKLLLSTGLRPLACELLDELHTTSNGLESAAESAPSHSSVTPESASGLDELLDALMDDGSMVAQS